MSNLLKTRPAAKAAALILAAIFAFAIAAVGCKLDSGEQQPQVTEEPTEQGTVKTPGNPVVISSPHLDYTLYDFRQSYYSNQYYMYLMYGLYSAADYFDIVVNDDTNFLYVYNAAIDAGVELDADEKADLEENFNNQLDNIISQYQNDVDESVTDDAERRATALELLNEDLAEDGLDYETFISLAWNNMQVYSVADKYYNQLHDSVEVSDEDVSDYVNEQRASADEMTIADFKNAYEAYCQDQGFFPVYVPEDCFSVNHIYLQFETDSDGNGGIIYKTESTAEDEAKIENALPATADFDAFMELEVEYGDDPGMDEEAFRENGYLIHGDFDYQYFEGFVYAAMNLRYGVWTPSPNPDTGEVYELPELKFFNLKDNTPVVKVATESGVHYIIVNKIFEKGDVAYEKGDMHWLSWSEGAREGLFEDRFNELHKEWEEKYEITVYTDVFKAEFVPPESENTEEAVSGDAGKK